MLIMRVDVYKRQACSFVSMWGKMTPITPASMTCRISPSSWLGIRTVSYTHLDVYKRQTADSVTKGVKFIERSQTATLKDAYAAAQSKNNSDTFASQAECDQTCLLYTSTCRRNRRRRRPARSRRRSRQTSGSPRRR